MTIKVMIIAGTRPEAIKMAPVVMEFRKHPEFTTLLCNSGQHREMINETFRDFALVPDFSLDESSIKAPNSTHPHPTHDLQNFQTRTDF